jgi:hypothetical protein
MNKNNQDDRHGTAFFEDIVSLWQFPWQRCINRILVLRPLDQVRHSLPGISIPDMDAGIKHW